MAAPAQTIQEPDKERGNKLWNADKPTAIIVNFATGWPIINKLRQLILTYFVKEENELHEPFCNELTWHTIMRNMAERAPSLVCENWQILHNAKLLLIQENLMSHVA